MEWAAEEMSAADLGDERLNKRLVILLNTLGNQAQLSIPAACGGWSETKAAYRFFDNPNVKAEKVLAPHKAASIERIKQHKTVLLVQDTTTLNFSGQTQRTDIGPLNHEKHRGILLHPLLAVTPERLCLGVLDTTHWAREELHHWETQGEKNRKNHNIPLKDKESYKWLLSYEKAQEIAKLAPDTQIVTVADREADIYDLYHEAYTSKQRPSAYFLIRAMANRRLLDNKNNLQSLKLIEAIKSTKPVGVIEFEWPGRSKSEQRVVKQAIYIGKVRLSPPDRKRKKTRYEIVETHVVIASEIDAPQNQTPLEWILLTNVPVDDAASGYEMVKWYLCRWQIEVYFRILKSGCKVEKLQLETKERFDTCLTLYMIIAWRILYMTMLARTYPEASCEIMFTEQEWKVAYMINQRKKPPKKPITLTMMVNLIAQLGGYLNRRHDGEPGPTVLWVGLQRLRDFIFAQQIYKQIQ
ncbi:MAG: IS4 family transposase [Gammaproteobacteria bacterium]